MGLFGLFGKKKRTNSFGEDMNRLTPEGDLPFGWIYANKTFVDKIQAEYNAFSEAWFSSKKADPLKQYAALKSLILYMEDVKKLCDSKGECFAKWASDLVAEPKLLEQRKKELKRLEKEITAK
jgi:hypothetical protein